MEVSSVKSRFRATAITVIEALTWSFIQRYYTNTEYQFVRHSRFPLISGTFGVPNISLGRYVTFLILTKTLSSEVTRFDVVSVYLWFPLHVADVVCIVTEKQDPQLTKI
jgi:hypothetical protein